MKEAQQIKSVAERIQMIMKVHDKNQIPAMFWEHLDTLLNLILKEETT